MIENTEVQTCDDELEAVEITEESLEKVGGGTVGIWFY
jgi:hypothetical protein